MQMTNFSEKLKAKMSELDLTQEALAKLIGLTRGQIGHYLKDRRSPPIETLYKIAKAIETDPRDLIGDDSPPYYEAAAKAPPSKTIPNLRVSEIDEWLYNPIIKKHHRMIQMPVTGKNISPKAFLFEVTGSAMVNPHNQSRSVIPGEHVLVEPEVTPQSGQLVLVKFGENDFRIRQYQEDGARKFLKSFEPHLPIDILEDSYVIMGTIIIAGSWRDME